MTRAHLIWLAVDLDGTLAEGVWSPDDPLSEIGPPIRRNIVKAREAARRGYKIIVHTARPWADYERIEEWCLRHEVPFRRIVCGKVLAAAYVDDRAIHESEASWLPTGGTTKATAPPK